MLQSAQIKNCKKDSCSWAAGKEAEFEQVSDHLGFLLVIYVLSVKSNTIFLLDAGIFLVLPLLYMIS